jgi:hypothetical protein
MVILTMAISGVPSGYFGSGEPSQLLLDLASVSDVYDAS